MDGSTLKDKADVDLLLYTAVDLREVILYWEPEHSAILVVFFIYNYKMSLTHTSNYECWLRWRNQDGVNLEEYWIEINWSEYGYKKFVELVVWIWRNIAYAKL